MTTRSRALLCLGASTALIVLTGLLGPSAVVLTLPQRRPWLPPYWLDVHPSPWLVVALVLLALAIGGYGVHLGLCALAAGWRPRPSRLAGFGVLLVAAVALVPPMGSGDVLMYAAYGRIAELGGDPYVTSPQSAVHVTGPDPVIGATEPPWQHITSVYGPITTWLQQAAAWLGHGSTHATVWWLHLLNALAFAATGLLVARLANHDESRDKSRGESGGTQRALLLVLANPLLIWTVVAGSHNDAQAVLFAVAAFVVVRRTAFGSGLLLGVAGAMKLSMGLYGLALLWALRRSPRRLAALCAGSAIVLTGAYAVASRHAIGGLGGLSGYIAPHSPWKLLFSPLHLFVVPEPVARRIVTVAALATIVVVAVLLARALPSPATTGPEIDDPTPAAVRTAAILSLAWLFCWPYTLPWYDLIAWVPLAALGAGGLDRLLLARTLIVAAAYVPGRVVELPAGLALITARLRDTVAVAAEIALFALLARWCLRHRRRQWTHEP
ncbi:glycosyltransferase 87 family protein [Flindersiella endophytica]